MPGLSLGVMGGVRGQAGPASVQGKTAAEAAFGPGVTAAAPTAAQSLSPVQPFGLGFWIAVGAAAGLVLIRQSLPA